MVLMHDDTAWFVNSIQLEQNKLENLAQIHLEKNDTKANSATHTHGENKSYSK